MTGRRTGEEGYLYEVPFLAIVIGVVGLILVKVVPHPWMAWAVASLVSAAVAFFLWYNFLAPGWLPGGLGQQVSIAVTVLFLLLAVLLPPVAKVSRGAALTVLGVTLGGLVLVLGIRVVAAVVFWFRRKDLPER